MSIKSSKGKKVYCNANFPATFQTQNNSQRLTWGWYFPIPLISTALYVQRSKVLDWQHIHRSQGATRSHCHTQDHIVGKARQKLPSSCWSLSMKPLTQVNILLSKSIYAHFFCYCQAKPWASNCDAQICSNEHPLKMAETVTKSALQLRLWQFLKLYRFTEEKVQLTALSFQFLLLVTSSACKLHLNMYCLKLISCLQPYIISCQSFALSKIFISKDFVFIAMGFMETFNSTRSAKYPFTVAPGMMTFHWHLLHEISQLLIHCRVLLFNANAIQYIVTMPKKKCNLLKNKCTLSR